MKLNTAFQGTGKVFRFSLTQMLKSKTNRIALILIFIMTLASSALSGMLAPSDSDADADYVLQRYVEAGLSEEQAELLQQGCYYETVDEADWRLSKENTGEDTGSFGTDYTAQLAYSVLLLMGCTLASSFIVRAVVDEKASKLVDLLLVSVRPASLLLGKVLAMQVYTLIYMAIAATGFTVSPQLVSLITGKPVGGGLLDSLLHLSFTPLGIIVMVITFLLGFLMFSMIAGLSGASCSSLEESSGALGTSMILLMLGYMVALTASAGSLTTRTLCLIPVLSTFLVPTNYLLGNIGLATTAASWAFMLILDLLLVWLAGRVYAGLIVYKGKRIPFFKMLRASLKKGGAPV